MWYEAASEKGIALQDDEVQYETLRLDLHRIDSSVDALDEKLVRGRLWLLEIVPDFWLRSLGGKDNALHLAGFVMRKRSRLLDQ